MSSQVLSQRNNIEAFSAMDAIVYASTEISSPPGSSSSSSSASPSSSSSGASTSSSVRCLESHRWSGAGKGERMGISSPPQTDGNHFASLSCEMNDSPNEALFTFPKDSLITPYEHTLSDLDVRLRSPSFPPGGATDTRSMNFDAALPRAPGADFLDISEKFATGMGCIPQMSAMSWYEYLFMQSYLQFSANFGPASLRNGNISHQTSLEPNGFTWTPNRFDLSNNRVVTGSNSNTGDCVDDQAQDSECITKINGFGMHGKCSPTEGDKDETGCGEEDETTNSRFPGLEHGEKLIGLEGDLFWMNRSFQVGSERIDKGEESDLIHSGFNRIRNGCQPPHHSLNQTANLLKLTGKRNSAFSSPLTLSSRQRKKLMKESHRGKKGSHRGLNQPRSATVHNVLRWVGKEHQSGITHKHVNQTTIALPHYTDDEDMETVSMETLTSSKVYNHRKVAGSKSPLGMSRKKFLMFLGLETVAIFMKDLAKQ